MVKCEVCGSLDIGEIFEVKDHSISQEVFKLSECFNCGLRFTAHPPNEDKCGSYYQSQDYISHSDSQEGIVNRIYHVVRQLMLSIKSKICNKKGIPKTLLDVGSGTGYFPHFMKTKGFEVMGIEVDDSTRQYSQNKFDIEVNPPSYLLSGQIGKKFGYITLWHVLEHLYGLDTYFESFSKHLEQKGRLIIAVPNYLSYDAQQYKSHWAAYDVPRHLWHFTPQSMAVLAERHGFKIIDKRSMPFDPFYNSMLSSKYRQDIFPLISGFFMGLIALLKGWINVDKATSIIYIMEKK